MVLDALKIVESVHMDSSFLSPAPRHAHLGTFCVGCMSHV